MKTLALDNDKVANLSFKKLNDCKNIWVNHKYVFTMSDFKEQVGHDDSLPYSAILWVNFEPFARCYNDGWGGPTTIEVYPGKEELKKELDEIVEKCKFIYDNEKNFILNASIDFIADHLAFACL